MPPAAEVFVLRHFGAPVSQGGRAGASEVEAILRQQGKKESVFISFMSVMELAYILEQEQGQAAVREGVLPERFGVLLHAHVVMRKGNAREPPGLRCLVRGVGWQQIVRAVESINCEEWDSFWDRLVALNESGLSGPKSFSPSTPSSQRF